MGREFEGLYKMATLIERRAGQGSHQKDKNESSLEESKSSGDDNFSLSELQSLHWLGLLLSQRKVFLLLDE